MTEGQVPPRVQWEGLLDRGAYYLSPQHCIVFHRKHSCCVPETAVSPLQFVFSSGRIAAGLALRRQTVITQNQRLFTT